jgi:hypothetical protein
MRSMAAISGCARTSYQVAFGTPALASGAGRPQLTAMSGSSTLKEALIAALVEGKDCEVFGAGAPDAGWEAQFSMPSTTIEVS